MPVQKTSQGFKDISLSFKRHPVTNDVLPLKNEDAIKRSVQNLVRTQVGEVFFNELIGTKVEAALFDLGTYPIFLASDTTFSLMVALSMNVSFTAIFVLNAVIYVLYAKRFIRTDKLEPSKSKSVKLLFDLR